jgi:tetratricopeptide (TPR) repeat protein
MKRLFVMLLVLSPIAVLAQHSHKNEAPPELITGLGDVNHPVSTANAAAQKFFNQGLALLYGFNHEEAVRSFKQAAALDPQLAMAHWGAALALGSNYNMQAEGPALLEAYSQLQKARALEDKASESDRSYIEALAKRYSADLRTDPKKLAIDYKNAMGELSRRYPDDLDAATLYAESMMNLQPWKLWTADGKPAEGTEEIVSVLESVLRRNPNHPGANHYYIHAVEASKNPDRALSSAARLGALAPQSGHLVHMPSHIYIRTGDYEKAAQSNSQAIVADRKYISRAGANNVYTMMYYNHNVHFLASANAMMGNYATALKNANELEASVNPHLKAMPMLEMFAQYPMVTMVRFGRWDVILKTKKPDEELKTTTAFWHFGRGMAFAGNKATPQAETEFKRFQAVVQQVPTTSPFGNNTAVDVLRVAEKLLAAKIALVKGDKKSAYELFTKAVQAEDAISYAEPPDWDLPVREVFGGALLRNGDNAEAENVFRGELSRHPRNGRALFGLAESLKRQGKTSEAKAIHQQFQKEWASADVKLSVASLAGVRE